MYLEGTLESNVADHGPRAALSAARKETEVRLACERETPLLLTAYV